MEFDPEIQDRFDYFIYLLKKNGVYVNLDGLVSFVGFSSDLNLSIAPRHPNSSKVQMFVHRPAAELGRRRVEDPDSCESVHENRSAG